MGLRFSFFMSIYQIGTQLSICIFIYGLKYTFFLNIKILGMKCYVNYAENITIKKAPTLTSKCFPTIHCLMYYFNNT